MFFISNAGLWSAALHGDWPWHVALYKDGAHVCDGSLMNELWLVTTASCFQGYQAIFCLQIINPEIKSVPKKYNFMFLGKVGQSGLPDSPASG